ncbi:mucin-19-like isoform X2 [Amphibalanus amphitrite]|uniref:mucin-19-like isoform X2 n=1 Tax=Amphibalanus amphitrite TaxID=1232801 RepID=UPI001C8FB48D|nr:mucin-19-like isoform X2 [Amphibalanus amphitrite]
MNKDDEEDKTNKKSQSRSRTRESSGSSDPDFETSAAVGGRRGGYATRRTRQVESDPPPHDLSRILPRDPPDCLRRGTKRKSQSSPRLLCFDPAPEDSGGGLAPAAAGRAFTSAGGASISAGRASTSAGGASTSAGRASTSAGGASTSTGRASTSSGGPSTAPGGPSTSAAAGARDSATPNVAAGGSRDGLDLSMLGSRVSTPTAGPSLGQLYKIRLAVAAASRSAGASRPASGSVDVSSVSSVVSTPEGSASAPWADTETDSQPPRLGSPEASTPAASSASASPTFGPPLLCPVVERLPEALAAAARPEASRPQPPRPASQRRKRPPARRSRSTSTTRRPPSSPLTAGPRSAFASVSAEPAAASRASSVSGASNVSGASSQAVAETHTTGLGLLCQAAEAAEAMAAAAQTFTAAAEVSAAAANAARSEPQSRAGGRIALATSSFGTAAVTTFSSGIATAIATSSASPVTAPSAGPTDETSAGPTTETSAGLARSSSAGLASTSSAVPGTPERIAGGGDGRSPGPSSRQGTPLKLYRVGAKTADGSCCWTTISPHKDSGRASGTAASAGPSGVKFNLEKSESGAARRSASAEGPSSASTGRPRGPERTPEKPSERRRPSRSPRQNSRSLRRKPKSPRQSPRSYRQDSRSPRRDSRTTGRESARRSPRKSRSSKSPHQYRDGVSEETMAQAEDSVQGAAALQQEAGSSHAVLRNLMEQPRSYGHRSVELPRPAEPLTQETLQNVPAYQQAAGRPHETTGDLPGVAERLNAEIHQQPRAECHDQGPAGPQGTEQLHQGTELVHHGTEQPRHTTEQLHHATERLYYGTERLHHGTELLRHGAEQLHHDSERPHHDSERLRHGAERPHYVPEQLHQDTQQLHHDMETAHPGADERRHGPSHSHHDTERSYRATEIPHDAAAAHYQTGSLPLDTREVHYDSETLRPGIARPGRGEEALRLEVEELHVGTEYHYQNFEKQQNVECGHDQEWQQTAAEAVHQGDADPRELDSLLQETRNFHEGQESIGMARHHQSIAGSSHSDVKPIDIGYANDRLEAASFARSRDIPQHHAQHAAAQVPQRQPVPGSAYQGEEGPYPSPWGSYQTPDYHAQGPDALQDRCEHPNQEQETHQQVKSPHRDTEGAHRNTDDLSMKSASPPPAVEGPLVHEDGAMQGAEDPSKKSAGGEEDVLEEARTGLHYRKKRASNLSADSSMNASTEHPVPEVRPAMGAGGSSDNNGRAAGNRNGSSPTCSNCGMTFHSAGERIAHKRSAACLRVGQ